MVIPDITHFDLAQTLDNGQAFRWRETEAGKFSGIAHGRRLDLVLQGEKLVLENVTPQEYDKIWKDYFDFSRDYAKLRKELSETGGETLKKAMDFSPGLRLMRQDVWETLISFILSQNSNIPRIKKMIALLCNAYGQKLPCGEAAFPSPEALAALSAKDLAPIRSGYRAAYIIDAARQAASGIFDPKVLETLPSDEIKNALLNIRGVGPKVAECVLLYGFGRLERYPVDIWIKRAMSEFYPCGFPPEIQKYSGLAQQFLFHYVRNFTKN